MVESDGLSSGLRILARVIAAQLVDKPSRCCNHTESDLSALEDFELDVSPEDSDTRAIRALRVAPKG